MHGPYVNRIKPPYADLNLDFYANPTTGDVSRLVGEDAIKRSVRNLVMTNHYERPFQSYIGGNVRKLLFDNINSITAMMLKDAIKEVINNLEPRVNLQSVTVAEDIDNNGYNITLQYIILNRQQPLIQSLFLERIR
jgi:phage baseplate assembly protein W